MRDPDLRRYWIEFEPLGEDEELDLIFLAGWSRAACGVTAHSFEDALVLVRENLVLGGPLPAVRKVIEDVDLSTFEDDPFLAANVLPHVGPPIWRGIWFPSLWYTWES